MALPDDDRRAVAARLAATAPATVDALAAAIDEGEELREVLVDVDGEVVGLTQRRALLVSATGDEVRSFEYGSIVVRRRDAGLGIDALVEGASLVLEVARSTFVRLGVVAEGAPPGRATWLPVRGPAVADAAVDAEAVEAAPAVPSALPPPGWHPDPSGRHWWRWWDGRGWTDHVADGGAPYVDPLPPR